MSVICCVHCITQPSLPEGELERLLEQCISKQHSGTGDGGHTSEQQQQHLLLADIQANES